MSRYDYDQLYINMDKKLRKRLGHAVRHTPGDTLRSFSERAIRREISRYHKYRHKYSIGDTYIEGEDAEDV